MIVLCPACGKLAYWSSHFGCYICEGCHARFNEEQNYEPVAKQIYDALRWMVKEYAYECEQNLTEDAQRLKYALLELQTRDWLEQPFIFHERFTRIVENAIEEVLMKRKP